MDSEDTLSDTNHHPFPKFRNVPMLKLIVILIITLLPVAPAWTDNTFKEGGKEVGQGFKKMGKETGQAFKEGGKEVGQGFKKMGKETGEAAKKTGKPIGEWFKEAGKKTGEAFKQMGRDIRKFFKGE